MSSSDDSTRPLSVADLLARNGTIGAPPVGGRRRRRRRNSDGVSVAELTGEIPVIRTGEIPVFTDEESLEENLDESVEESVEESLEESVEQHLEEDLEGEVGEEATGPVEEAVPVDEETAHPEAGDEDTPEYAAEVETEHVAEEAPAVGEFAAVAAQAVAAEPPPLAGDPLPRRSDRLERGYDPRPVRRSSGAEQMAYDPVDESVDLADLVEEHFEDPEQLRSYLRTSQDTLFSGGTVADDLARRGIDSGETPEYDRDHDETDTTIATLSGPARPRQTGGTLWNGALAVLQSLLAVVLGAGLFIGFDQLWRWNNLVALILSVLVVLTLAAAVRIVRKTEDIVSTLTAVAVGLLVTLGPLALQST